MSDENPRLMDLARLISDGVPVDWERIRRETAGTDEARHVREMMRLEQVVAAHRSQHSIPRGSAPPADVAATSDRGEAATPSRRWGPLLLIETIGRGAFGEVLLARDPRLDRRVALKLLHPDVPGGAPIGDAVIEEGRLMARISHPNVVTVYGAERHDGRVGVWMELIQGEPLSQILAERGVLGAHEAGLIGLDLCRALAAVHQSGLVHHDVKAQNVMRERGGRIVLMDFSAGRELADIASSRSPVSGTPLYMPPEAFLGVRPDHRGDIYGLGVLLYHLVTGEFPIVAETLDDVRRAHLRGAGRPVSGLRPDLPPAFVRVVEKALASDPALRFESAAAMEQALAGALGVEGGATAPSRVQVPRSFAWVATIAAGAAVLAVALASYVAFREDAPPEAAPAGPATRAPETPPDRVEPVPSPGPATIESVAAPPVAPPVAPPAAPKGAYTVEAALLRGTSAADRLENGDRVRVGDALSIRLRTSRPLWVYVVNEDDHGVAALLFPLPGSDVSNPIPAGETRLPGSIGGESKYWQVTSAGGREHFLVVASPKQLLDFERETAALVRPSEGGAPAYAVLSEPAKERLRGVTGLASGPATPSSPAGNRLFEIAKELEDHSEVVRGAWVRRIDLENPAR